MTCKPAQPVALPGACVANGGFNACTNSPQSEICDGLDNDCDGGTDDLACDTLDTSGDGRVDAEELVLLGRAFGACDPDPASTWWGPVDFDGSGRNNFV